MEQVFSYIIGPCAAVMMPVIFTVVGLCFGIKFGDALKAGLKVGVGLVWLFIVVALRMGSNEVMAVYHLTIDHIKALHSEYGNAVSDGVKFLWNTSITNI